jgi:hypothetical protein
MQLPPLPTGKELVEVELAEEQALFYTAKDDVIHLLHQQIQQYQSVIEHKDKIIRLLERNAATRRY